MACRAAFPACEPSAPRRDPGRRLVVAGGGASDRDLIRAPLGVRIAGAAALIRADALSIQVNSGRERLRARAGGGAPAPLRGVSDRGPIVRAGAAHRSVAVVSGFVGKMGRGVGGGPIRIGMACRPPWRAARPCSAHKVAPPTLELPASGTGGTRSSGPLLPRPIRAIRRRFSRAIAELGGAQGPNVPWRCAASASGLAALGRRARPRAGIGGAWTKADPTWG